MFVLLKIFISDSAHVFEFYFEFLLKVDCIKRFNICSINFYEKIN
ncbi:hypothetical protein PUN28_002035 [Cardiocondyla obscurior]|uniref:Uncharacterized protein n=1 Tax=Cardiocondyla obscurior TaxID=286306 RepID=A0AAW2GS96_9HYME